MVDIEEMKAPLAKWNVQPTHPREVVRSAEFEWPVLHTILHGLSCHPTIGGYLVDMFCEGGLKAIFILAQRWSFGASHATLVEI